MKFYIRLLSYKEACNIIEFINKMVGCYANIAAGGVSVTCVDYIDEELIRDELFDNYPRFEITETHPKAVEKQIIKDLKIIASEDN